MLTRDRKPTELWIAGALITATLIPAALLASYDAVDAIVLTYLLSRVLFLGLFAAFAITGRTAARGIMGVLTAIACVFSALTWGILLDEAKVAVLLQAIGVGLLYVPQVSRWAEQLREDRRRFTPGSPS